MELPQSEAELERWVTMRAQESITLDFKAAGSLENTPTDKKEISKDVSAFANSAGGTIIYGIQENKLDHTAEAITPIDRVAVPKEWLEQVINSGVNPRLSGVRIDTIELPTRGPSAVTYLVSIPQSDTAHQATGNKYYKRFNFESVPMEDFEVRQAMNRATHAAYQAWLNAMSQGAGSNAYHLEFQVRVLNTSEIVGQECCCYVYVPAAFFSLKIEEWQAVQVGGEVYFRLECLKRERTIHPGRALLLSFSPAISYNPGALAGVATVIVRLFDSGGLALAQEHSLKMPGCQVGPANVLSSARKPALSRP